MAELVKKKLFKIGASYAIIVPMGWLRWIEKKTNKKPDELVLEMEVGKTEIIIRVPEDIAKKLIEIRATA